VEAQLVRVAKMRDLSTDEIVPLVNQHTQGKLLGIFGESGVNVLK
jgi:K+-transporting ATPase ATPase C chain